MMHFEIKEEYDCVRFGILKINGKSIRTPCFWIGIEPFSKPNILDYMHLKTILVNGYKILDKHVNIGKIHDYFKADAIMMDSGGFQLMKKNIDVSADKVLKIYRETKPDIGVVLDYPFNPQNPSDRFERWKKTIENTKIMFANSDGVVLMPVVHGYTTEELKNACREVKEITDPKIVGIGSLVPLVKTVNMKKFMEISKTEPFKFLIRAISTVRNEFPESFLHVFGVGSSTTMHLMFSLGVDSIDSMSWRLKASYGAIQLPAIGDRFITAKNGKRKELKEFSLLKNCTCPVCKNKSIEERKRLLDNAIANTFYNRAIHNAFVYVKEYEEFMKSLENGNVKDFLEMRMKENKYYRKIENYKQSDKNP
ncbi:MAG: tRNA-guanine transglycosylase [Candidatus Aenigmarchaeota archaeon]|nr:tRNA-guanine transglycosylase [Candidatus Aenigmarchaeota archaeon]